ncbi:hypothetical protein [Opitutus terrae]|uniref:Uncharacterized protein n=1 Tax=Opitutus terrae (strain DSM 11246 / JCM 15787 / PB90-1) TaxID=452637 RepID=B1ZVM9_OPITP|nr:hypothetical protein [Opitutus terrae]ACB74126.1 hypothetical protein Oter_0838 [Opitutus terrae PB90-1]
MGFFDRLAGKKPSPPSAAAPTPAPTPSAGNGAETPGASAKAQLIAARERLDANDLPGAMTIYEQVLATAGDRADILVTISADLGSTGHVREIVELVGPRYDAERHGAATGINLLQAYLVLKEPDAAQHVLDLLFALNRPDLEERLFGFSNAIAELLQAEQTAVPETNGAAAPKPEPTSINLVSISKPIWFYGLEPLAEQILPTKGPRLRRVAFAQLSLLGIPDPLARAKQPEDELGRLSRALPLWFAETFYFSPHYTPIAAVGLLGEHYALFGAEWTKENLQQLISTTKEGLDYVFTGALRQTGDAYELLLRVWEVKKLRERKQFSARWTRDTADAELAKLHEQVRLFMEWTAEKTGLAYAAPASPAVWLDTLGASLSTFLAEKKLLPNEQLADLEAILSRAAIAANTSESASLAFLTLRNRTERLALAARLDAVLASSPLIAQAQQTLGG